MADALCGPSNSLQNFQKHASVDRTLQQDRLRSRQSPIQGFRTPNPNAGALDAEYNAFLAGESVIEPFDPQQAWQHEPPPHLQSHLPLQQAPDWALDFQHLHVDDTRSNPIASAHFHQQAPMRRSSPGPWQNVPMQNNKPQGFQHQPSRRGPGNMSYMMNARQFSPYNQQYSTPPMAQHSESQVKESFDEEAFAKAFDQAANDQLSESQGSAHQETSLNQEMFPQASATPEERIDYRIGSDRILDDSLQRQEDRSDARDADELAETAGLLLENVKHDQSSKFQESNFLSLMRQLRDKEVKVEGDAIVNVAQPLHPGGYGYPGGIVNVPGTEEVEGPRPTPSRLSEAAHMSNRMSYLNYRKHHPKPSNLTSRLYNPSDHPNNLDLDAFLDGQADAIWPELSGPVHR